MHYCDGMLPSVPRRPFCPHRPFSVGHCSWLDFIFHYAPKTIWLPYLNTTWSKEKKKTQPTLHLWKAQTYMASGVEAGITAFKGRLEWPHLQCWMCGPPAVTSLHGHHVHLALAMGMNFIARNNAMLGMQLWDHNGIQQIKIWSFSLCTAPVRYSPSLYSPCIQLR